MSQNKVKGAEPKRVRTFIGELDDRDIAARYEHAIFSMAALPFLTEIFEQAACLAIDLCENARVGKPRKPYPETAIDRQVWTAVSESATSLRNGLAASKGLAGLRLLYASKHSNMRLRAAQLAAFPKLLEFLAKQEASHYGRLNQVVRPLMLNKPSRKRKETIERAEIIRSFG